MTHSVKEAAFYINKIMEERCVLIVSATDHNASIMTAIVDILDDEGQVVFDYSGSQELDRLIRRSESIDFSTNIDDINIHFSSGAIEDTMHKGRPAFSIKMPRQVHRVQRREFYRAAPPLSERPDCVMEYDGHTYKASVIDISIGGIGALIQNADFKVGDVVERCRITTPIGIEIEVSLKFMYVGRELNVNKERRYGCQFTNVSAWIESSLQKYVMYLQGQELARRRELESF